MKRLKTVIIKMHVNVLNFDKINNSKLPTLSEFYCMSSGAGKMGQNSGLV